MMWPFQKKKIDRLEKEIIHERGKYAQTMVKFEQKTYDLDAMIKRSQAILDKGFRR